MFYLQFEPEPAGGDTQLNKYERYKNTLPLFQLLDPLLELIFLYLLPYKESGAQKTTKTAYTAHDYP